MKLDAIEPPRRFRVGRPGKEQIVHCLNLELADDEMVTLTSASGSENDIVRKPWGYYATSSLNARLPEHGLRPALVEGLSRPEEDRPRRHLLLVERQEMEVFEAYLAQEEMRVICWLDNPDEFPNGR